jgi:hypothetical protein
MECQIWCYSKIHLALLTCYFEFRDAQWTLLRWQQRIWSSHLHEFLPKEWRIKCMTFPAPSAVHLSACKDISWAPPWRPMNEAQPYKKIKLKIHRIAYLIYCSLNYLRIVEIEIVFGPHVGFIGVKFTKTKTRHFREFRNRCGDHVRIVGYIRPQRYNSNNG